ncbi:DUF3631 domain-containing protein [Mesorhizobium sp. YR577]|uniref:DUF3631 domain-containing protein n=1 Tax=Mesorhizobium sp. YR577 TaxID=1884373 RepID=UPI001587B927|nr:DUF3631 domain-containing protein [Mesorhizobium sp. YR577]
MAAEAIALWTVFTHCFDAFDTSPRLALISPMPGCGKTEAFKILRHLTHNALLASNTSSAAIFRLIEQQPRTLLLDELDTQVEGNEALRGILNSGHSREGATVLRAVRNGENGDWETHSYSTWAPVAMAKIGKLFPTWASRSIIISMRRKRPDEDRPHPNQRDKLAFDAMNEEVAIWAKANIEKLRNIDPEMPKGLANRDADNWKPLFAIADLAGGHWPKTARKAAAMLQSTEDPSRGEALLAVIKRVFHGDSMRSEDLCDAIKKDPDDSDIFKGLSARSLAKQLQSFDIKPDQIWAGEKIRGYKREWFEDAWLRYT